MDTEGQINFRLRWSFRKRTNGKFLIETRLNVKFGYIERNPNITILQISLKISKLFKGLSKFEYVGARYRRFYVAIT
jgi:hypothetical protein